MSRPHPDAQTPVEHLANCGYLVKQLEGWLQLVESMPADDAVIESAQDRAEALASQATLLVIRLRRAALARAARRCLDPIARERAEQLERRGVVEGDGLGTPGSRPSVICAWCDKEAGITRSISSGVSHGMCRRHLAAFEAQASAAEIENIRKAMPLQEVVS